MIKSTHLADQLDQQAHNIEDVHSFLELMDYLNPTIEYP